MGGSRYNDLSIPGHMTLRQRLQESPTFEGSGNIFYQKNLPRPSEFEKKYLALRETEGRIYSDAQLRELPEFQGKPELRFEWGKRKLSTTRLMRFLNLKKTELEILELGSGNGWLSNLLATALPAQVLALDLNETELLQGARVFSETNNLNFLYGDIFSVSFHSMVFDVIILASVIQYFPDLEKLIQRLSELLEPGGEIHILDSPIYFTPKEKEMARMRSEKYFKGYGLGEMTELYFHHQWKDIEEFKLKILYNSNTLISRAKQRILSNQSPFSYIIIYKP